MLNDDSAAASASSRHLNLHCTESLRQARACILSLNWENVLRRLGQTRSASEADLARWQKADRDISEDLEDIRRQYPNDGDNHVEVIVHSSLEHGEYLVKPEAITRSVGRFCWSDAVLPLKKGTCPQPARLGEYRAGAAIKPTVRALWQL